MSTQERTVLLFGRDDVDEILEMPDVIAAVEEAQRAWGRGEAASTAMNAISVSADVSAEKHGNFMSYGAFFGPGSLNVAGLSWIACCIHNPKDFGLPYATGIQVVNDPLTGLPLAIMERSRLTEMVTAGASAVGAKHLANADAASVAVIGCGGQARTHLEAIHTLFRIETATAFDVNADALGKYVDDMSRKLGRHVLPAASAEDAARSADILAVCISPVAPVVKGEWIKPGALVIAMCGGGGELHPCVYPAVDKIVVDDARFKYKSHFEAKKAKGLVKQDRYLELGKIAVGHQTGREGPQERILFMHSGLAANHLAGGYLVYTKAKAKGLGTEFRIL